MHEADPTIEEEMARIRVEEAQPGAQAVHRIARFFIRSARIAAGFAVFVLGCWVGGESWDLLSRPFAVQSLVGLVGGLALGWLAWLLLTGAYAASFGAAPDEDDRERRRAATAYRRVAAAKPSSTAAAERPQPAGPRKERRAWTYYVGWLWARLRSPR
jgi:hypothetical protein